MRDLNASVEDADRRFVCKLHELRGKLAGRQATTKNRSAKRNLLRSAVLFITLLTVSGIGFAFFHMNKAMEPVSPGQSLTGKDVPSRLHPATDHSGTKPDTRVGDKARRPPPPATPATELPASETPLPPLPAAVASSEAISEGSTLPVAADEAPRAEADNPPIESITARICSDVRDRHPFGETDTLHLKDAHRVYVWMEVKSKTQPFVIEHVYYRNGQRYCTVPLDIRYPRMRTWSYITLQGEGQAGSWSVEIISNGRVLETVGFKVVESSP